MHCRPAKIACSWSQMHGRPVQHEGGGCSAAWSRCQADFCCAPCGVYKSADDAVATSATCLAEINACDWWPCTNGTGATRCSDTPAASGGGNSTAGRTCQCLAPETLDTVSGSLFYANDTLGCAGELCLVGSRRVMLVTTLCCVTRTMSSHTQEVAAHQDKHGRM